MAGSLLWFALIEVRLPRCARNDRGGGVVIASAARQSGFESIFVTTQAELSQYLNPTLSTHAMTGGS